MSILKKEFLFSKDEYFRSCHAATILAVDSNEYLVSYFSGTYENHTDTAIWLSRKVNNRWIEPEVVANISNEPHYNPVLFDAKDGNIYLFFKAGPSILEWKTYVMQSNDKGKTWTKTVRLVPNDESNGRGPAKNKMIILSDGSWLAPGSQETKVDWKTFTDRSIDKGKTWQKSNLLFFPDDSYEGHGMIQPTLWESSPNKIHMLIRSTAGCVFRSDSANGGRTWCEAYPTSIKNNNSGLDIVQTDSHELYLICNPVKAHDRRTPLSIFYSNDNGENWKKYCDIETEDVTKGTVQELNGGEFSYPAMIINDNKLAMVYTVHRKQIAFCEIEYKS